MLLWDAIKLGVLLGFRRLMGSLTLVFGRLRKLFVVFLLVVDKWIGFPFLLFLQDSLVLARPDTVLKGGDNWSKPSHLDVFVFEQLWYHESWRRLLFVGRCAGQGFYSWRFAVLACLLMVCITWWFMKSTDAGRAAHVSLTHPLRPPP
jgi:hypothetical protein